MRETIITDLDGTLIPHKENGLHKQLEVLELLPGVKETIHQWLLDDSMVIILTGRRESVRKQTEEQLYKLGIPYDILIMGAGRGKRILINDKKPDGMTTCEAINPNRNDGLL